MIIATASEQYYVPMEYTHFGYNFLSEIRQNGKVKGYHPGLDLNKGPKPDSDLRLPVVAPASGEVVFAKNAGTGWGNIVVIRHDKIKINGKVVYSRMAHFDSISVKKGDYVAAKQEIGKCGKSGTTAVHLHWEALIKELSSWTAYVYGWSKSKLLDYYLNPLILVNMTKSADVSQFPEAVEWVKKNKISNGERSKDAVTREECWEMMRRMSELPRP